MMREMRKRLTEAGAILTLTSLDGDQIVILSCIPPATRS